MTGFDCGRPALNEWLMQRALRNESRFSRTYVVCDGGRVVAHYRLAEHRIGAVLVQARDDDAKRFYRACAEFIEYPADSRMLFLPIETVAATFG
ncbi:MAG: hypothetical protein PGN34_07130 [Methylobacterium frigidaeris]